MKADLVSYVHIDGQPYGPGDDVPKAVLAKMDPYCFVDGVHPLGDPSKVQKEAAKIDVGGAEVSTDLEPDGDDQGEEAAEIPPKQGAGSGKAAWAAYATANGVDVGDAKRDEIIDALDAAGIPTE